MEKQTLDGREFGSGEGKGMEVEWRGQRSHKPEPPDPLVFDRSLNRYVGIAVAVLVALMLGYAAYIRFYN